MQSGVVVREGIDRKRKVEREKSWEEIESKYKYGTVGPRDLLGIEAGLVEEKNMKKVCILE